jgi:hypothetical protein
VLGLPVQTRGHLPQPLQVVTEGRTDLNSVRSQFLLLAAHSYTYICICNTHTHTHTHTHEERYVGILALSIR